MREEGEKGVLKHGSELTQQDLRLQSCSASPVAGFVADLSLSLPRDPYFPGAEIRWGAIK